MVWELQFLLQSGGGAERKKDHGNQLGGALMNEGLPQIGLPVCESPTDMSGRRKRKNK